MKYYNIQQIKKYLDSQDSLGDIHYNLSEENIDKANEEPEDEGENDDWTPDDRRRIALLY